MPGLGISKAWLTMPLPCGFALMIIVGVIRLFRAFPVGMALALIGAGSGDGSCSLRWRSRGWRASAI